MPKYEIDITIVVEANDENEAWRIGDAMQAHGRTALNDMNHKCVDCNEIKITYTQPIGDKVHIDQPSIIT